MTPRVRPQFDFASARTCSSVFTLGSGRHRRNRANATHAATVFATLAFLTGCPSEPPLAPSTDLALPMDLGMPDASGDAAVRGPDLATPYVQQPGCSKNAWCWLFPQPPGNTLLAVWGSSPSEVWAGGESGALVHYTGGSWQNVLNPNNSTIRGLWGSDPSHVFLVGDRGTVMRYDGTSWSAVALPATPPKPVTTLYGVFGTSATDVWFVGAGGVALHYDGTAATETTTPDAGTLRAVWGPSPTSTYAVTTLGAGIEVLHFDPVAKTWAVMSTIPTSSEPTALWGTADNDFFVSGTGGDIYHYNGTAFGSVHPAGSYGINALGGSGAAVFAIGDVQYTDVTTYDPTVRKGSLLKWNGTTFFEVASAPQAGFFGLWGSGTSLFFVGTSGTIGHYDGATFTSTSAYEPLTGVGAPMVGIGGTGPGDLIAAGDFGATLRWNGSTWTSLPSNVHVRFRGASGAGNNLFAIAQDLALTTGSQAYHWTGSAWLTETVPAMADLRGVWSGGSISLAVGARDLVLQRSGTSWTAATVQSAGSTLLRAAFAVDATHIWAVGGGSTTDDTTANPTRALFSSNGTTYQPTTLPVTDVILRGVFGATPADVWAVGDAGTLLHWNGTTWQKVPLGTLAALNAVWGRDATTVYVVGNGGNIRRWDGFAWQSEDSGTTNSLLSVWGIGADVYALGRNGTVLHKSLR